jgi:hypothetical protein
MGTIVRYAAQNGPGSSIINRIEVTGSYSPTPSDYYIGVDSSVPGGAITITLPLAAEAGNGKVFVIKDEGGNCSVRNITIAPSGSEQLDGAALGYTLVVNYEAITVVSDGVGAWYII